MLLTDRIMESAACWFILFRWLLWSVDFSMVGSALNNNIHKNVSDLLDNLLRGYDNSIRPDFGGSPLEVEINIMVRSMGPISEVDMTYSMDMYFRQSWIDKRLSHTAHKGTLALSISMLEKIWKPDTYFYNGRQSYLHTITTPNKFVRLYQDGRVLYSSRLTVKASCPMHLEDFPMDTQRCPLKLGSFGYTTRDVLYRWKADSAKPVDIAADMKLSQFDLISTPSGNATDKLKSGEFSNLIVSFHLQRHMGNFLIQVYGPCTLLVVLSWVSFWLNREATADRVSLGVTTVLTMTFLGLEARTDLPKVAYPTALDFFVFLSYGFIFGTIIQFAVVHYFTKKGSGELYFNDSSSSSSSSEDESDDEGDKRNNQGMISRNENPPMMMLRPSASGGTAGMPRSIGRGYEYDNAICGGQIPFPQMSIIEIPNLPRPVLPSSSFKCNNNYGGGFGPGVEDSPSVIPGCPRQPPQRRPPPQHKQDRRESTWSALTRAVRKRRNEIRERQRIELENVNSVSKIDKFARIFFPFLFFVINVFYWYYYLYKSKDDF